MKFSLAASALFLAGLAAAADNSTAIVDPARPAPPVSSAPAPISSAPPAPPVSSKPTSRYPPYPQSSATKSHHPNPWHPTTLPICHWCTATVTCHATEWVAVDCTTLAPWTKCELPATTCLEATVTVIVPCTTTKVPETPICVVTTVPPTKTPVKPTTPACTTCTPATTLPVFISGASGLKSGAIAGAAVAIAAAVMVFV